MVSTNSLTYCTIHNNGYASRVECREEALAEEGEEAPLEEQGHAPGDDDSCTHRKGGIVIRVRGARSEGGMKHQIEMARFVVGQIDRSEMKQALGGPPLALK